LALPQRVLGPPSLVVILRFSMQHCSLFYVRSYEPQFRRSVSLSFPPFFFLIYESGVWTVFRIFSAANSFLIPVSLSSPVRLNNLPEVPSTLFAAASSPPSSENPCLVFYFFLLSTVSPRLIAFLRIFSPLEVDRGACSF